MWLFEAKTPVRSYIISLPNLAVTSIANCYFLIGSEILLGVKR